MIPKSKEEALSLLGQRIMFLYPHTNQSRTGTVLGYNPNPPNGVTELEDRAR